MTIFITIFVIACIAEIVILNKSFSYLEKAEKAIRERR